MTRIKLEKCPFCGNNPKIVTLGDWFTVKCSNIKCSVLVYTKWKESKEEAVESWNKRK